jgi:predicted MFS family arabinose efflux permease
MGIFSNFVFQSTLYMVLRFSRTYFICSLLLIGVEVFIGARMHDRIIRPYGGDYLVVILLYCLVRAFLDLPILTTAMAVLFLSYAVEVSQYFHLADHLGLRAPSLARTLLGTSFSWVDLLTYTLGILTVLAVEKARD